MALLDARSVTKHFGGVVALRSVDLNVKKGEIVGLIGPNGSGKTTFFNCATGVYRPDAGQIFIEGENVVGLKAHSIANMGVGRTFQLIRVFKNMTVLQNMLAGQSHLGERIIGSIASYSAKDVVGRAVSLLEFVNLAGFRDRLALELSYGQQKLLEFARALMRETKILLLDEPVAGVNPVLMKEMLNYLMKARDMGHTFLVVEHNIPAVMSISDRIYVLSTGEVIAEGSPQEIQSNRQVIEAYFGA